MFLLSNVLSNLAKLARIVTRSAIIVNIYLSNRCFLLYNPAMNAVPIRVLGPPRHPARDIVDRCGAANAYLERGGPCGRAAPLAFVRPSLWSNKQRRVCKEGYELYGRGER